MMKWSIINFLFLTIMTASKNDKGNQSDDTQLKCTPFNAIILWHTGSGYRTSFARQMHLIIKLISDFPEGTEISLVTFGSKITTKLHFRKDMTDDSWKTAVKNHYPGESGTHVILNRKISDAILKYENQQMAEEVFLVVDNRSVIANEQKAAITLGKRNTFIIFYGGQTMKHGWANLATDTRHFVLLEDNPVTINDIVKSILMQICRDFVPHAGSTMDHPCEDHTDTLTIICIVCIIYTSLLIPPYVYIVYEIWERNQRRRRKKGKTPVAEESQNNNQTYPLSTMDHHQLKSDFMQLLTVTSSVCSQSRWDGVKADLEHDHRYQDVPTDSQRENWFDEHIQHLLKSAFMQLLRDTPSVCSQSRWDGVKADLEHDHRYQDVPTGSQRESWFDEYIQNLDQQDFGENTRIDGNAERPDTSIIPVGGRTNLPESNLVRGSEITEDTLPLLKAPSVDEKQKNN